MKPSVYEGLKIGLELHCQLNTAHKLFCNCPTSLAEGVPDLQVLRRLRPTQSEFGQVDPAALFEFQKGKKVCYEVDKESSCLVEADEEPPHSLNQEALESTLIIALMLGTKPVDELHVMRKVVIDGSNTTGFQRTAAVGLNGKLTIGEKEVPIQHVSLEEDAARKTDEKGMTVNFRIDRLGIPLVEIATAPVIYSPLEAEAVAYGIGRIVKATKKVKRGLGTIRQDLNISLKGGSLVEIKGIQQLALISKVVELEFQRQKNLIEISSELKKRQVKPDDLEDKPRNLSTVFDKTQSKLINKTLAKGGAVFGVKLPRFKGLLGKELIPNIRLGTEMSWRAMFYGKVGGIFHTDELPGYGISNQETLALQKALSMGENDAAVIVADNAQNALEAIKAVKERAIEATVGVPEETRAAMEDGSTRYMRPRPGAARMYPETDIPLTIITKDLVEEIKEQLPDRPEETIIKLEREHQLNKKLSEQLLDSDFLPLFITITEKTKIPSTYIATILTETLKSLERKGVNINSLSEESIEQVFLLVDSGKTAKESIEPILEWLCEHEGLPEDAVKELNLELLGKEELELRIDRLLKENSHMISQLKEKATGKLVGILMSDLRGRVNADRLINILQDKLQKYI